MNRKTALLLVTAIAVGCGGASETGLFGSPATEAPDGAAASGEDGSAGTDAQARDKDAATAFDAPGTADAARETGADAARPDASDAAATPDTRTLDGVIGCAPDSGVTCSLGSEVCCKGLVSVGNPYRCTAASGCAGLAQMPIPCDDTADCDALGFVGTLCCAHLASSGRADSVACMPAGDCLETLQRRNLCDLDLPNNCPNGGTCRVSQTTLPGFSLCF